MEEVLNLYAQLYAKDIAELDRANNIQLERNVMRDWVSHCLKFMDLLETQKRKLSEHNSQLIQKLIEQNRDIKSLKSTEDISNNGDFEVQNKSRLLTTVEHQDILHEYKVNITEDAVQQETMTHEKSEKITNEICFDASQNKFSEENVTSVLRDKTAPTPMRKSVPYDSDDNSDVSIKPMSRQRRHRHVRSPSSPSDDYSSSISQSCRRKSFIPNKKTVTFKENESTAVCVQKMAGKDEGEDYHLFQFNTAQIGLPPTLQPCPSRDMILAIKTSSYKLKCTQCRSH